MGEYRFWRIVHRALTWLLDRVEDHMDTIWYGLEPWQHAVLDEETRP